VRLSVALLVVPAVAHPHAVQLAPARDDQTNLSHL
jgi:hypothetical protein